MSFIEGAFKSAGRFINLDEVEELRVQYLDRKNGFHKVATVHFKSGRVSEIEIDVSFDPNANIIPAAPGYKQISIVSDDTGPPAFLYDDVIAWFVAGHTDPAIYPVTLDGVEPNGMVAVLTPSGTVTRPLMDSYSDLEHFKAAITRQWHEDQEKKSGAAA